MSSIKEIKNNVVIVAGGAKNLGGLISRDFATHGAKAVIVHYHGDTVAAVKQ